LSHWTECPNWENFKVNDFVPGMDLQKNPCDYFTKGKVKAATLSLSVLVMIEMFNAYNAVSEDNSLLVVTPLVNPYLIAATISSTLLHAMIVYVPFFNNIFSIYVMTPYEWGLVVAFAFPVILIDEILKVFARIMNKRDLEARLKQE
jgi:Ca2+-transporting ATPase